ncbi:hypothetical protein [Kitasatospora sp. MAP5-34]|uniref:hypothetical protein n=1 Tax=Kitasatospora sp. MAP5-34 TaxID=3035102 RepID=UPI002475D706|nr:hypothetical protein [Kitasatospora sp. MAP5-34]MDH6576261.1 hypothetical protein [Kitasatospora sp. MAP5-34]
MRLFRTLSALAMAGALALSAAPAGAGTAPAAAPAASAEHRANRVYISPWGSAHVRLSGDTQKWLTDNGVTLGVIAPFTLDPDGFGVDMPIGSSAGDHIDSKGRIFYPGGLTLNQASSGTSVELQPTWIRIVPEPGYSAGIKVNGTDLSPETLLGYTTPAEVLASGRPTMTGFRLDKCPFHVTQATSDLTTQYFGAGLKTDSMFFTLTPRFDYVPTS